MKKLTSYEKFEICVILAIPVALLIITFCII